MVEPSRAARRHVLFDLDGTLIDGIDDLVVALNTVLTSRALAPLQRSEVEPLLGDGLRVLARRAFAARQATLTAADHALVCADFLRAYQATGYAGTRLYAGVADTLRHLHAEGWRIGLASNKDTGPCQAILARLAVQHCFSVVAGGDATIVRKPDGRHLQFALAEMGFQSDRGDQAVMVGDHANDVAAARAAGIPAIAVALEVDDSRAHTLGAAAVVTDFRVLPTLLETLTRDWQPCNGSKP